MSLSRRNSLHIQGKCVFDKVELAHFSCKRAKVVNFML